MHNTDIKVTVVVPIYNAFDYLRPAMDSIIDQTMREIEIICVDDGSTDRSLDIIREYQKSDERIRIITENNAGPATARNKGLLRSRGEFVIFLDADDFYELTLLEKLYEVAKRDSLDIAIANFDLYNSKRATFEKGVDGSHADRIPHGQVYSKSTHPDSILQSTMCHVLNKMFRKSFLIDLGLVFAPELYIYEDVYFAVAALCTASRIEKISDTLVHHRVHSEQTRSRLFKKYFYQIPEVYLKAKAFLMNKGVYVPVARSFLNLSADGCHKVFNQLWNDARSDFWGMLHSGYGDSLGWVGHDSTDFDDPAVRDFVGCVAVYTYDQYKKLLDRGVVPEFGDLGSEDLKKRIKSSERKRKIAGFFSKFTKPFKGSDRG